MARCLAAAISHAPGLSGTPDCGHCSSAATRASCARSSATPTSRTIRANPAMSLGDSILQTASMARWVSVAVTATDHTIFDPPTQPDAHPNSRGCPVQAPLERGFYRVSGRLQSSPSEKSKRITQHVRDRWRPIENPRPSKAWTGHPIIPLLCRLREVSGLPHLADFGFAFPAGPVLFVKLHEADRGVDGLFLGLQLKLRVAADHLFGFGERAVGPG